MKNRTKKRLFMGLRLVVGSSGAIAPMLWPLEALDGLLTAERRHRLDATRRTTLARILNELPIRLYQAPLGLTLAKKASSSFLKKRTKKLLFIGLRPLAGAGPNIQKFFASFFQKRRSFLLA